MAQPGAQAPQQEAGLHRRGDRRARGVRRLARPRPGDPRRRGLQRRGTLRGGARGGDRPRRPDLPDQLHRLPQLRRLRRRHAARRLRPDAHGVEPQHIYEALLTGPQADAGLHQRQPHPRGEARRHRLPADASRRQPELRRLRHGRPRPRRARACSPGSSASASWSASPSGSRPTPPARPRRRWKLSDRPAEHRGATPATRRRPTRAPADAAEEPIANPGLPAHQLAAHRRRRARREARRAPGRRAVRPRRACCTVLFVRRLLRLRHRRATTTTIGGLGASNVALGLTLAGALLFIGIGIIQWARKLMADHEIVEMRHPGRLHRRGPRGDARRLSTGIEESGIGRRPLVRNSLLGAVGLLGLPAVVLPARPRSAARATKLVRSTIWKRGHARRPRRRRHPIRPSDIEIGDLVNAEPEALLRHRGRRRGRPRSRASSSRSRRPRARSSWSAWSPTTSSRPRAATTGASTASSATPRSAPTSAARSPCTSARPTTCCARATSPPSTWPTPRKVIFGPAARALPQLPLDGRRRGYLVARATSPSPSGPASGSVNPMSIDTSKVATTNGSTAATAKKPSQRRRGRQLGRRAPRPRHRRRRSSCARSSPTTGPSCSARSRCGASSSCCSPASS